MVCDLQVFWCYIQTFHILKEEKNGGRGGLIFFFLFKVISAKMQVSQNTEYR